MIFKRSGWSRSPNGSRNAEMNAHGKNQTQLLHTERPRFWPSGDHQLTIRWSTPQLISQDIEHHRTGKQWVCSRKPPRFNKVIRKHSNAPRQYYIGDSFNRHVCTKCLGKKQKLNHAVINWSVCGTRIEMNLSCYWMQTHELITQITRVLGSHLNGADVIHFLCARWCGDDKFRMWSEFLSQNRPWKLGMDNLVDVKGKTCFRFTTSGYRFSSRVWEYLKHRLVEWGYNAFEVLWGTKTIKGQFIYPDQDTFDTLASGKTKKYST